MFLCSRGHVRSSDQYKMLYFNFRETMSAKLEMYMAYEKGSPPTMVTWHKSYKSQKWKKLYFYTCTWLMTTKLDKMMAYGVGPPYTKSHDSLIMWLYVALWQKKTLYLQFHKSYRHQTWQGGGSWHKKKTQKITSGISIQEFFSTSDLYR